MKLMNAVERPKQYLFAVLRGFEGFKAIDEVKSALLHDVEVGAGLHYSGTEGCIDLRCFISWFDYVFDEAEFVVSQMSVVDFFADELIIGSLLLYKQYPATVSSEETLLLFKFHFLYCFLTRVNGPQIASYFCS